MENSIPEMIPLSVATKEFSLPYEYLRGLCVRREIVHIRCGKKYLINKQKFIEFLNTAEVKHNE